MSKSEAEEFARLADWVEGRLPESEARVVEEQVEADGGMHADAAWLRAFARISEVTVIASPPPALRDALVGSFEAYAGGGQRPGTPRIAVASLSFDSGVHPAPGWRTTSAPGSRRQFVYSSEVADVAINLRARPFDGLADLHGQIFPVDGTDPGAFGAQLLDGAFETATTATSDLGEFSFRAVPPGTYEVVAYSDRAEIRLAGIEVHGDA